MKQTTTPDEPVVELPERIFLSRKGRWLQDADCWTRRESPDEVEYVRADLASDNSAEKLGEAIAQAAIKVGIIDGSMPLTGPHLVMLCDNLADAALRDQDSRAGIDRAAEKLERYLDSDAVAMACSADGKTPKRFVAHIITKELSSSSDNSPDQDSVEMQNEQAEREMRQTAPCYSESMVAKDSSLDADLPIPEFALADLKLWFRRVLDDPKHLKYRSTTRSDSPVGEGYSYVEIPEWEFRQKQDLVAQASDGVNASLVTQPTASASELSTTSPDERVLQPETNSDARERSMALVVAWADSQKISLAKMGSAAVNNLVFRIAPYINPAGDETKS